MFVFVSVFVIVIVIVLLYLSLYSDLASAVARRLSVLEAGSVKLEVPHNQLFATTQTLRSDFSISLCLSLGGLHSYQRTKSAVSVTSENSGGVVGG